MASKISVIEILKLGPRYMKSDETEVLKRKTNPLLLQQFARMVGGIVLKLQSLFAPLGSIAPEKVL